MFLLDAVSESLLQRAHNLLRLAHLLAVTLAFQDGAADAIAPCSRLCFHLGLGWTSRPWGMPQACRFFCRHQCRCPPVWLLCLMTFLLELELQQCIMMRSPWKADCKKAIRHTPTSPCDVYLGAIDVARLWQDKLDEMYRLRLQRRLMLCRASCDFASSCPYDNKADPEPGQHSFSSRHCS